MTNLGKTKMWWFDNHKTENASVCTSFVGSDNVIQMAHNMDSIPQRKLINLHLYQRKSMPRESLICNIQLQERT